MKLAVQLDQDSPWRLGLLASVGCPPRVGRLGTCPNVSDSDKRRPDSPERSDPLFVPRLPTTPRWDVSTVTTDTCFCSPTITGPSGWLAPCMAFLAISRLDERGRRILRRDAFVRTPKFAAHKQSPSHCDSGSKVHLELQIAAKSHGLW
jgi:hypothetical protein